ncbi:hypothetical protein C8F01DRAFT_1181372 [Mycena amicta]|nr:hypothetical protein C8F01DRAFT_1181372 [Mycena amicta]
MADTSLPDEIISEILSPALTVDDDVFTESCAHSSPFANFSESTSAYLLVCKSWLRVATPLLYNVVVIRSKAQAKALAGVLSKNGELGRFIKKLRVEGGHGAPMQAILKCAPNVTDLFLSLNMFALDSTDGLCKGFAHISPTKLILDDDGCKSNKAISKLAEGLVAVIPKWDRLTTIDLSNMSILSARNATISKPIIASLRLTTIVVKHDYQAKTAFDTFTACPLQVIHIKRKIQSSDESEIETELKHTNRNIVLKYDSTRRDSIKPSWERYALPSVDIAPSLDPHFVPMHSSTHQIQDRVWSHILQFAFYPPKTQSYKLLLVSKRFLVCADASGDRIGTTPVTIKSGRSASRLAHTLVATPAYGAHIKVLNLHRFYVSNYESSTLALPPYLVQPSVSEYDNDIRDILRSASKLVSVVSLACRRPSASDSTFYMASSLGDLAITWQELTLLGQTAGATLRDLSIEVALRSVRHVNRGTAGVFAAFVDLQTLDWRSHAEGVFVCDDDAEACAAAFPNLENFVVWDAHKTFFEALSKMTLPSLRHLTIVSKVICYSLLASHGDRLTTLCISIAALSELSSSPAARSHASTRPTRNTCVLDLCPNLTQLTLLYRNQMHLLNDERFVSTLFNSQNAAQLLTTIKFILPSDAGSKDYIPIFEDFFATFATQLRRCTPALQDIGLSSPAVAWPTNERDIAKNVWVRIAENLLAVGVQVADKSGKKWRSRLSTTRAVNTGTVRVRKSRKEVDD